LVIGYWLKISDKYKTFLLKSQQQIPAV